MEHIKLSNNKVINPFEKVKFLSIAALNDKTYKFKYHLDKASTPANMSIVRVNESLEAVYNYPLKTNLVGLVKWYEAHRGVFKIETIGTIHFRIEEDILYCW